MTKAYQAYAKGSTATAETPRKAAEKFFSDFPTKRKCDVIEGEAEGPFFTVSYGRTWPQSWKGVTKKTSIELPEEN